MSEAEVRTFLKSLFDRNVGKYELYTEAFTHGSTGKSKDYQRLEFLGDRVLGLVIAQWLYAEFPEEAEGRLSSRLNQLVSGTSCADIARQIGLAKYIHLGKQAKDDGGADSTNILGDVMEAIIGAYYLDAGYDAAAVFIRKYWAGKMDAVADAPKHPKSALQEWAAAHNRQMPEYRLIERSGPHHSLSFTVSVTVKNVGESHATANSKQSAEKMAAEKFLREWV